MKQDIKKILCFLSVVLCLSACNTNLQVGPNPNIEEDFKYYDDNKILASDSQGYSENLSYTFDNKTYKIIGKNILWGDVELLKINTSEKVNCQLSGEIQVEQGNYKIIKINSENEVINAVEDEVSFDKSIVLEKGVNILEIVGKPVDFRLLNMEITIPENIEDFQIRLPLTEQDQNTDNSSIENVSEIESIDNEEGDFRCVNYLQKGNILLSGKFATLNGKKVLLDLDLQEEFKLFIKIKCKPKDGSYSLILQDGKGKQKSIVSDEEEWGGNILLNEGTNKIILIGDKAIFSSITIESNSEEINPEDVKH